MDMTIMTKEWTTIAFNIQVFMIQQRDTNESRVQNTPAESLFAEWRQQNGPLIKDVDLALWCVDFIARLKQMTLRHLKQSADWDGLLY